ncbi:MAG: carboxypeptidase-like regulatory domain-containing protein [Bacteroidota bacterium]
MKPLYYFTLCLFLFLNGLQAQQEFVRGRVLDSGNGEPVIFATVRIKGKAIGVITNREGDFRVPMKFRESSDTLAISSMGYQKREVPIPDLSLSDISVIWMQPGVLDLDEAVVTAKGKRRMSARGIVRRAIRAIPQNYPKHTFSTIGYYRDYQYDKGKYVNLNEAILEVFDRGFDEMDNPTTKIRIYEHKQNSRFKRDSLAADRYDYKNHSKVIENAFLPANGGNEFVILSIHDAIRNYRTNAYDFVNNMEKGDLLENHSFKRGKDVYLGDESLYVIGCSKNNKDYTALGKLFIAKGDFGIHKLEYSVYDHRSKKNTPGMGVNDTLGKLVFEVKTEYKSGPDNILYLNYISFHNTFLLAIPPKFVVSEVGVNVRGAALNIYFNNPVQMDSHAEDRKNYTIRFQGKRIKVKEVRIVNDTLSRVHLDMKPKDLNAMIKEMDALDRRGGQINTLLQVHVKDIHDVNGNLVNEWTSKAYDQFREYFVQKNIYFAQIPTDGPFMDKRRPIFEDQPVQKPDDFLDYWMNTPLKTMKN